ncbi:MAG: PqqD family protein [Proteobacteria bacterium]|nr:PqqD family protein [Pseudomonadota bacterium]
MSKEANTAAEGTRLCHAPSVAWQRVGDEVVVLDVPRRTLVGLNPTASALWESIASEGEVAASIATVAERLQQPVASLNDEIARIAKALLQRELLQVVGAQSIPAAQRVPGDSGFPAALPGIAWEEQLEDSGVYAACAKDPFGEISPGCTASPSAGSS